MKNINWLDFLKDVFICSLGSYGGPEAHYGVFSQILVERRKYLTEEELTELIGLFAIVPGPSSTQTITAIGYYTGGPLLAFLTFLVWVLPAIFIMALIGVFFTQIDANESWKPVLHYLPAIAVCFIIYAAFTLSKKVIKGKRDWIMYGIMFSLSMLLVGTSMWMVPLLLVIGGLVTLMPHWKEERAQFIVQPKWMILFIVISLALLNEWLVKWFDSSFINLYKSFYRYGYSVIGGGQIVIPLMIEDLVQSQSLISLSDFLSGYAIDQAIPGPLFSFSAFVSARSFAGSNLSLLAGIIGGLSIFLPGILLVFFIFPLWKSTREIPHIQYFLKGVTITAASLILMTAITQILNLPVEFSTYLVVSVGALLLLTKKIPAPLLVVFGGVLGFIF